MRVALISLNIFWEDKEKNRKLIEEITASIDDKVELIILPEMSFTGFSVLKMNIAEALETSETLSWISELAIKKNVKFIVGILLKIEDNIFNSAVAINQNGNIDHVYHKMHLFSFAQENKFVSAGSDLGNIDWFGGMGLTICYDLRFPELFRLVSKGKNSVVNIANWPLQRIDHWFSLLKARAIENQCFMLGVNRSGTDGNGLTYPLSSCVFDPNGQQIEAISKNETVEVFDINTEITELQRSNFPFFCDNKIIITKN